jgi:hypothetical protein
MKCPLTKEDCLAEGCAWYRWESELAGQCSILAIAIGIQNMERNTKELDNELASIADYLKKRPRR